MDGAFGGVLMAAAAIVPIAASKAKETAKSVGQAAVTVATTPIYSRRTIRETEDRNGEPVVLETEVNVTPAAVVGTALAAHILGLGVGVGQTADGKTHLGLKERPRVLINYGNGGGGPVQNAAVGAEGAIWRFFGLGDAWRAITGRK